MSDRIASTLDRLGVTPEEIFELTRSTSSFAGSINRHPSKVARRHEIIRALHDGGVKSEDIANLLSIAGPTVRTVVARHKRATGQTLTPGRKPLALTLESGTLDG